MFNSIIFLLFFIVVPWNAYAYIDPGTGSYLFQLLLGVVLGGALFFRQGFSKIFGIFRRGKNEKTDEDKKEEEPNGQ